MTTGMAGAGHLGPRSRQMFERLLWIIGYGGSALILINAMTDPSLGHLSWVGLLFPAISFTALLLVRRGRELLALRFFLWGLLTVTMINGLLIAGVRTPNLAALSIIVVLTSWLLNTREAHLIAIISIVYVLALGAAQQFGLLDMSLMRPPLNTGLVIAIYIAISAIFGVATGTEIREENARTRALSISLQHELDEHKRSEDRFATLFRSNPLPAQIGTPTGVIVDVNDAWADTFGIPRATAVGKRPRDFNMWQDINDLKRVTAILERDGEVHDEAIGLRVAVGEVRKFLLTLATIDMADGPLYVATLIDLTDRLTAEQAQREMNVQLEARVAERTGELTEAVNRLGQAQEELVSAEKLASLGSLVAGISHELNTPIGNAVTVTSTLRSRVTDMRKLISEGGLKRSALDEFINSSDEMSALIERSVTRAAELVASFKQVAVDQTSEQRREFALHTLVEDIVATLKPGFKRLPLEIVLRIDSELRCDSFPGPLGQIITNLIQNAAFHGFDGKEQGCITISAESRDGQQVILKVVDDGIGMDQITLARIFDPFFTTKLGKGGSGLGLSICHRIATRVLGGSLTATSTPGAGSTFRLTFPLTASGKV